MDSGSVRARPNDTTHQTSPSPLTTKHSALRLLLFGSIPEALTTFPHFSISPSVRVKFIRWVARRRATCAELAGHRRWKRLRPLVSFVTTSCCMRGARSPNQLVLQSATPLSGIVAHPQDHRAPRDRMTDARSRPDSQRVARGSRNAAESGRRYSFTASRCVYRAVNPDRSRELNSSP